MQHDQEQDQDYEDLVRHEGLLRMRSSIARHEGDNEEEEVKEKEEETKKTLSRTEGSKTFSEKGRYSRQREALQAVAVVGPDAQGDAQAEEEGDEDGEDDKPPVYEGDPPSDRRSDHRDLRQRLGRSSTSKRRNRRASVDGCVKHGSVVDDDPNNLGRLQDRNGGGGSADGDSTGDIDDEAMNSE
jgi:hypothetical protein